MEWNDVSELRQNEVSSFLYGVKKALSSWTSLVKGAVLLKSCLLFPVRGACFLRHIFRSQQCNLVFTS